MTELIYLTDSYKKELTANVISVTPKGKMWEIVLDRTIFYPQGGGQSSDRGIINAASGTGQVKHVRLSGDTVIHECAITGSIAKDTKVALSLDWPTRYQHMRVHSAGHIVHEAVKLVAPSSIVPVKGEHGAKPYIEYEGSLTIDKKYQIEKEANIIVEKNLPLVTEFVSLEELMRRSPWVPAHLPKNKPLRILTIGNFAPIPDGGTQVAQASEVGPIIITNIENDETHVRVHYAIELVQPTPVDTEPQESSMTAAQLTGLLLDLQQDVLAQKLTLLESKNAFATLTKQIKLVPAADRQSVGVVVTQVKQTIEKMLAQTHTSSLVTHNSTWADVTMPGILPPEGHLHIVTQAISEITRIFERIGFTRVRHPEVDWDWYPFESLNMPPNHPARDEWETFFINTQIPISKSQKEKNSKFTKMVLTPHTSNGQVREMEKGHLPIRMINIAKCYRRQIDVSHVPMFHQFEGLYVDHEVSIAHLKGVLDYFVKQFFGPERKARIRPFHFQFTEPSFEVDISCGVCLGVGCKLCKSGWLELGGAGMVHPVVLRNGGVDPNVYSGFAFGWGIERTSMMKSGTKLDDIRLLYNNDLRFLEQF